MRVAKHRPQASECSIISIRGQCLSVDLETEPERHLSKGENWTHLCCQATTKRWPDKGGSVEMRVIDAGGGGILHTTHATTMT